MAGDGCASFLVTGKRQVKEAMDRVALQAERCIAIFDGHVREVME